MKRTAAIPQWLITRILPQGISLQILDIDQHVLFSSSGKWLHPLLEAEQFILREGLQPEHLILHDRIAGRAAAALAVHIGFSVVKAEMMSTLAEAVYKRYNVPYAADTVVVRIDCKTEELVTDSMELHQIYEMIVERAKKSIRSL